MLELLAQSHYEPDDLLQDLFGVLLVRHRLVEQLSASHLNKP